MSYGNKSASVTYDAGLRQYMIGVYNMMALALLTSGLVGFFVKSIPGLMTLFLGNWVGLIITIVTPFVLMWFILSGLERRDVGTSRFLLMLFAASMGVMLSAVFQKYTGTSITRVFFIAVGVFGSASLYGYSTNKDLTSMGTMFGMALWGLIIAGIVNVLIGSTVFDMILSAVSVVVFVGLTAYDTQQLKEYYYEAKGNPADIDRYAVYGAMSIYLDFLNIFLNLLRLFGNSND